MRKAGSAFAKAPADKSSLSQVASPAVTSNAADVSAASGKSVSRVAESHDSATPDIAVKRSSSRWADRPVPVLAVEFPEPWSIVAAAHIATATGAKCAGNLKWSGWWDLNPRLLRPERSALPGCATPRFGEQKGNIAGGGRVSKPNRQGARPLAGLRIESASDLKKWAVVDVCRGKG